MFLIGILIVNLSCFFCLVLIIVIGWCLSGLNLEEGGFVLFKRWVIFLRGCWVVERLICWSGVDVLWLCRCFKCFNERNKWVLCLLVISEWILLMMIVLIVVKMFCVWDVNIRNNDLGVVIKMLGGCWCIFVCLLVGVLFEWMFICGMWIDMLLDKVRLWILVSGVWRFFLMLIFNVFSGEI